MKKISLPTCLETSIVELWASDGFNSTQTEMAIFNLTQKSILDAVNTKNYSEVFLYDKDFSSMLGKLCAFLYFYTYFEFFIYLWPNCLPHGWQISINT